MKKLTLTFTISFFYTIFSFAQYTVCQTDKISSTHGNLPSNTLENSDFFGTGISFLGDIDGDGNVEIAVGAGRDDDGGNNKGAFYILSINDQHEVRSTKKISSIYGGFTGYLHDQSSFGSTIEAIGDLDNDGITEIAVGAGYDSEYQHEAGALWVIFLNQNGTVKSHQKINSLHGGFNQHLPALATFGATITSLGDLDEDGVEDIGVGAYRDNSYSTSKTGAYYILFMKSNGTVKSSVKVSEGLAGFTADLKYEDYFGHAIANIGDVNGDGITDIAVASQLDSDGGFRKGAIYVIFLNRDGTVKNHQKISDTQGNFNGYLDVDDNLGSGISHIGDMNQDGIPDIVVGSDKDDDGGENKGAIYLLMLNRNGTVKGVEKISETEGNLSYILDTGDRFGRVMDPLSFSDGRANKLLVTSIFDDDGGTNRGAVYILTFDNIQSPDAGEDIYICENTAVLNAQKNESKFTAQWSIIMGAGKIHDTTDPNAEVNNLSLGKNTFVWTISNENCSWSDTVNIFFEQLKYEASAGDDKIICSDKVFLDANRPETNMSGEWIVLSGGGNILQPQNPNTEVVDLFFGQNKFIWKIQNQYCTDSDTVTIYNPSPIENFPNVITPNGDDKNEFLVFENIQNYPESSLIIVNRWGKVVFSTTSYKNNWYGIDIAPGIYFYYLDNKCLAYKGWLHVLK